MLRLVLHKTQHKGIIMIKEINLIITDKPSRAANVIFDTLELYKYLSDSSELEVAIRTILDDYPAAPMEINILVVGEIPERGSELQERLMLRVLYPSAAPIPESKWQQIGSHKLTWGYDKDEKKNAILIWLNVFKPELVRSIDRKNIEEVRGSDCR